MTPKLRSSITPLLLGALGIFCGSITHAAENWPQFRGVDARGVSIHTNLPDRWSATENVEWKAEIPGRGWSSPVVWGERVFVTTVINRGETEAPKKGLYLGGNRPEIPTTEHVWKVLCLDLATGKTLWDKTVHQGRPQTPIHVKNSYASETPATDGERVYACFGGVGIFAFDFDGKEVWKHPLEPRRTRAGWGTAASPVLHGGRLYYQCDNDEQSYLLALDKLTGKEVWRTSRDEKSNWSPPFVWQHAQRTEIVTAGSGAVRSYDLDGKLLWSLRGMSSITISMPYAADGLLYVSSGYVGDKLKALYAIKPGASGDITPPEGQRSSEFIAWWDPGIAPYNPTTLVHKGKLYVLYDRGLLSCFDAKTGQPFYLKERLPRGPGFTTSPWAAGDKIFCLDEDGQTHVLRAGEKFELLHTNPTLDGEMCMGTPALVGDRLLVRTDRHLYSIRNASRQP
ncbi:MAG: PQQ-binding-like beta-propeller repeat protein [Verrucomicrobiota bacterium]|nr:PQQ-binding-like beta-propeller repeat protein [Verrucomicrobiota bacterium]